MTDKEYREYLSSCGFNDEEVEQKIKERDIMRDLCFKDEREAREITSQSYQRSQKALSKKICDFLGVKK